MLLTNYRRQGAGVAFFRYREAHAHSCGYFRYSCFCAVQRPNDHPDRPPNYVPLDQFWNNRGYRVQPQLRTYFRWKDLGENAESQKPMIFWMKTLQ